MTAQNITTMRRQEFINEVCLLVEQALPPGQRDFRSRKTLNLLKIHFNDNYRIHYELMILAERKIVEIGLHFEDGPKSTDQLLRHFDNHIVEIKHELGQEVELERWTKSWGHLFEVVPLRPLTREYAIALGGRLVRFICVAQPILDEAFEAGLVSLAPHAASPRPRFFARR